MKVKAAGERRIARLIEASAPGVWDWDLVTDEFLATQRLRDIFGFQQSDVVDMTALVTATHPDDRTWAALLDDPAGDRGAEPRSAGFRIHRVDTGELRWVDSCIWRNQEILTGSPDVRGYSGTVEDTTDRIQTAQALTESEERLRLAIEAGKMAVWEVDLQTGGMTQSPELNILCGFEPDATINLEDIRALYNPGEIERLAKEGATVEVVRDRAVGGAFEPWRKGALKSGVDRTQVQAEVAITTPAGIPKRLLLRAQYALSSEGRPRLTGLLVDITETKMAEERLAVVARELQHRVKNSLSVIRAIAVQSLRGKADPEAALQSFLGRLSALAAATDLILERGSPTADLLDVIDRITQPYRDLGVDPFALVGASVPLSPNVATAIGMVLHELCTNAIKYGALSVLGGEVLVSWRRDDDGCLVLNWQERNGPAVLAPRSRGFGSRLLKNVFSDELRGKVTLNFEPEGLRCRMEIHI